METIYNIKPDVIYRRGSLQKYGPSQLKYSSLRTKFGPSVNYRKLAKKYRKPIFKRNSLRSKQRLPKPRYAPPKKTSRHTYGAPKKTNNLIPSYYSPEPAGFAEPPMGYDHHPIMQNYGEPPVDSYGAPLKIPNDDYPTSPALIDSPSPTDHGDYQSLQEYQSWNSYHQDLPLDSTYSYSKKKPSFKKPDEQVNQDEDNSHENTYSDLYGPYKSKELYYARNRKKPQDLEFAEINKKKNSYYKYSKSRPEKVYNEPDEILVGGQYAEPPARYVPKFLPSAPMFTGDGDFNPPKRFIAPEVAATSATISPYVNYKNGNIAFSPQNLNDAFSIVDK
ncbi:hypothetical protein ACJJTC_017009 [Scirpophaga incertulas]